MGREKGLGDAEIEILNYVAEHQPVSVGEVADHVASTSGKARTTVQTMMERLREKDYLVREQVDGVYRYSARKATKEVMRGLVARFVEKTLGGSLEPLMAYLSRDARLSRKEIEDLKEVLAELEDTKPDEEEP